MLLINSGMEKVILILLFFSSVTISCKNNAPTRREGRNNIDNTCKLMNWDSRLISDSMVHKVSPAQLLVRFDDKYPIGLDVIDSLLYIIMTRSDTAIYVYNEKTSNLCDAFGYIGQGPQDVLSPSFLKNNYEIKRESASLEFYDLDARKIFKNKGDSIIITKEFFGEMYPSDQLNISGEYWIGRKLRGMHDKLFQIYNTNSKKTIAIDMYPVLPDLDKGVDKSRLYSVTLACNKDKGRIVVGMYYFDLILVYNFAGELLQTLSISDNYKAREAVRKIFQGEEYIGFSQIYATNDYCYLRRCLKGEGGNRKMRTSHIIRLDWNGHIVGVYYMDEYTTADFCVDEASGTLYCISQQITVDEEYYDVVSYKL